MIGQSHKRQTEINVINVNMNGRIDAMPIYQNESPNKFQQQKK